MAMETEERPRKLQKVDHYGAITPPKDSAVEELPTNANPADQETKTMIEKDYTENEATAIRVRNEAAAEGLSKNQLKKLQKRERWEAGKEWRKAQRKEKLRAKKERDRAAKAESSADPNPNSAEEPTSKAPSKRELKKTGRGQGVTLPITFVVDCNFDDLMIEKERISLSSQITRAYSDNSKAPYRAHYILSSFNGLLKERFDTVLAKQYENWKGVTIVQEDYAVASEAAQVHMMGPHGGALAGIFATTSDVDAAKEEGEIIYLSSDSPNTLTELKPFSTYIIGGLVDKNRHKGVCYKSAMNKGVKTAKLPISDYMEMASRFVLTTNHVIEIMIKWLELGDWGQAFSLVMPKRKGGTLKKTVDEDIDNHKEAEEC